MAATTITFQMPALAATLVAFRAAAASVGGGAACDVDLAESGNTVLAAPLTVNATGVLSATVQDASTLANAVMTITINNVSGTVSGLTLDALFKLHHTA